MADAASTRAFLRRVTLAHPADFDGWRNAARTLLAAGIAPEHVFWTAEAGSDLFAEAPSAVAEERVFRVPARFVALASEVALHRDQGKWALLYRLLFRLAADEPRLLEDALDADVARAEAMAKAVRRDAHKMKAFVRFREIDAGEDLRYVAWFEPGHLTLRPTAPFFVRRFASMRWSIVTPDESAQWDLEMLSFGPGGQRRDVPAEDAGDDLWRAYYRSIFNPARLKVAHMRAEMPKRYWKNLPEAAEIPALVAAAESRARSMVETAPTLPVQRRGWSPPSDHALVAGTLEHLRAAVLACRNCPLHEKATQAVFGEGPAHATIMLVGEQPGDQEDLAGRPFVGPAGQLLDRALEEAGLDRSSLYVTSAVKHFKFESRGKRRIHKNPNAGEVERCRWWLDEERHLVRPKLVVAMGGSATRAVLGRAIKVTEARGRPIELMDGSRLVVTVHPSYLLRLPDEARRGSAYAEFVDDLRLAKSLGAKA